MNHIKKYIIGIGVILIGVLSSKPFFKSYKNTDTFVNKIGCRLYEFNTISIETNPDIDLNKVQIKIGDKTVFEDNKQKNRIGQNYGHTLLDVYYDNLLIATIGHMKTNNWFTNDYAIKIEKKDTHYIVNHSISGPNANHDNFQKRYVYNDDKTLNQIEYLTQNGKVYNIESFIDFN